MGCEERGRNAEKCDECVVRLRAPSASFAAHRKQPPCSVEWLENQITRRLTCQQWTKIDRPVSAVSESAANTQAQSSSLVLLSVLLGVLLRSHRKAAGGKEICAVLNTAYSSVQTCRTCGKVDFFSPAKMSPAGIRPAGVG